MGEALTQNQLGLVRDYVPHEDPMILLDKVLESDDQGAVCSVLVGAGLTPKLSEDCVPNWVAIEYMAQTIAVSAGRTQAAEKSKQIGFLMGCRRAEFGQEHFRVGQKLHVKVELIYDDGSMAQFSGQVFDPSTLEQYAAATLSVYRPNGRG